MLKNNLFFLKCILGWTGSPCSVGQAFPLFCIVFTMSVLVQTGLMGFISPEIEFVEFSYFERSPIGVLPDSCLWGPRIRLISNFIKLLHILMDFLKLLPQMFHSIYCFFSSNSCHQRISVTLCLDPIIKFVLNSYVTVLEFLTSCHLRGLFCAGPSKGCFSMTVQFHGLRIQYLVNLLGAHLFFL